MKIHVAKNVDAYQVDGLPPGDYTLTVTATNSAGQASATVSISIPVPAVTAPDVPVVEP